MRISDIVLENFFVLNFEVGTLYAYEQSFTSQNCPDLPAEKAILMLMAFCGSKSHRKDRVGTYKLQTYSRKETVGPVASHVTHTLTLSVFIVPNSIYLSFAL